VTASNEQCKWTVGQNFWDPFRHRKIKRGKATSTPLIYTEMQLLGAFKATVLPDTEFSFRVNKTKSLLSIGRFGFLNIFLCHSSSDI
jgi:hypothetical protein